ncbi:hypothetical protein NEDG_01647 [Nematocida displodere]|uniref:RING-type domain-containing protein n=1 Tax=Nematocida displodere TaxID=1805483 RepID=A0A177EGY5_9MICR|nr:hypothetical protein NEDG_01647 [Nematocida displodere]
MRDKSVSDHVLFSELKKQIDADEIDFKGVCAAVLGRRELAIGGVHFILFALGYTLERPSASYGPGSGPGSGSCLGLDSEAETETDSDPETDPETDSGGSTPPPRRVQPDLRPKPRPRPRPRARPIPYTLCLYMADLGAVYEAHMQAVCFLLQTYMVPLLFEAEVGVSDETERRISAMKKVINKLEERTENEKALCFLSQSTLDVLLEVLRCEDHKKTNSIILAIGIIRKKHKQVVGMVKMRKSLESVLSRVKELVMLLSACESSITASMIDLLYVLCTKKEISDSEKCIQALGLLVLEEIKRWISSLFQGMHFYLDPSSPLLACKIVIKQLSTAPTRTPFQFLGSQIERFFNVLLGRVHSSLVQCTSMFLDLGSVHSSGGIKWLFLERAFKTEISACKIVCTQPGSSTQGCNTFLVELFNSSILSKTLHLHLVYAEPLKKSARMRVTNLSRLQMLTLEEDPEVGKEVEGIENFVSDLLCFRPIKTLALSFPYNVKTFFALLKVVYTGVEKLILTFVTKKLFSPRSPKTSDICCLLNSALMPSVKEISIHNSVLSEIEFTTICADMSMVQVRYGRFLCPLGACYIKQNVYLFRKPEPVALNGGLVFIMAEDTVKQWAQTASDTYLEQCYLCDKPYAKASKARVLVLPCGNIFHLSCISEEFTTKKNMCCPQCRKRIHMSFGCAVAIDTLFTPKPILKLKDPNFFDDPLDADILAYLPD